MFIRADRRERGWTLFAAAVLQKMRHLAAVGALLLTSVGMTAPEPAEAKTQTVNVIRNDPGGNVESRLRLIAELRTAGTRVEIRGLCASACTLFLGLPNTCVARSSRLGFHGPQSQYYGISLSPAQFERWSRKMADHYPEAIKAWFMAKARQKTMGILMISGSDAIRMGARPCN